jgi:hypothetical protein
MFFARGLDRANQLDPVREISRCAQAISAALRAVSLLDLTDL